MAAYNLVNGQSPPTLMGYEGGLEQLIPGGIETGADGSGHYLQTSYRSTCTTTRRFTTPRWRFTSSASRAE